MEPRTIAFHTFGCKVNQYETETLRYQLQLGGFRVVPLEQKADVYVVNSCSVTADADSSCRQLIRKIVREQPTSRIVVTGCYAERAPDELREISSRVEVFGNQEKPLIAVALGVPTECVQTAAESGVVALADRARAYIKVQDGCDAHCTYCIIPSVRPVLVCREPSLILREAENLIARGFKEIVLTGVRLGRYAWEVLVSSPLAGEERGGGDSPRDQHLPPSPPSPARGEGACAKTFWDLVRLVKALLELPGDFRIRLSSLEVTEIPDALLDLMIQHPKLCPHFHIPLQSGDDEILKRMGRWYTASDYRAQVQKIKRRLPDVALTADVIVGFPGEGEEHFQNSVRLLDEEGFSRLHVFRYSVRPGTPAERLTKHVDGRIKSARTRAMIKVDQTLRHRYAQRFVDRPLRILQEQDGGYTERYVRVKSSCSLHSGTFQMVRPSKVTPEGVLCN